MPRHKSIDSTERPSEVNRSERPSRTPINGERDILSVKGLHPDKHYCWVNDYNVDRWLNGGYAHTEHEVIVGDTRIEPSQFGNKVSKPVGNGVIAFLMWCPKEIYDEEVEFLNQKVDLREQTMQEELNTKEDGKYGSVEISSTKRKGIFN